MKQNNRKKSEATESACLIKDEARRLGFSACGIALADDLPIEYQERYKRWLAKGMHADMSYLERNLELRFSPKKLLPGTESIIMVALSYYPSITQHPDAPQIAYYAYGKDYHRVVKRRLDQLLKYIQEKIDHSATGRSFSDSAPVAERYWAWRAGLGWIGKNTLLIQQKAGSYYFLGALFLNIELPPDEPMPSLCGDCTSCIDHCPNAALDGMELDARRCISYLTIESKGAVPSEYMSRISNRLYGCDTCQIHCPWNRFARPSQEDAFAASQELLSLSYEDLESDPETYLAKLLPGSPMKRAGLDGLMRNWLQLKENRKG